MLYAHIDADYIIGSDECLKGDTFGGLIVAAVAADKEIQQKLINIGVCDSKKVQDQKIPFLAEQIKAIAKYNIIELFPVEYNTATQTANLTKLLDKLHTQTAKEVRDQINKTQINNTNINQNKIIHIVDQYPGCTAGDIHETQAESNYIEVAAASILARDVGLKQLEKLSQSAGFHVPKGSTHVANALEQLKQSKKDPKLFVKMHFKNVQAALK